MKLTLKKIRIIVFILIFGLFAGQIGYQIGLRRIASPSARSVFSLDRSSVGNGKLDFSLFWEVWNRVSASYLDKKALDDKNMYYGAIKGMVSAIGDPYTVFLPPEENEQSKEDLNGAFDGVGIELGYQDGQLAVVSPLVGTPADRAGVKPGDYILKINDKTTEGLSLPEAVKLIRGPKGSTVRLSLYRKDKKEPFDVDLTRDTIVIPSAEVEFTDSGVAHLKLYRFGDRTNEEWDEAVTKILEHKPAVKGVVLDLRNNPGGYLVGSVFIASEFLPSGVVVQQEEASGVRQSLSVDRKGRLLDTKLVVLINKGSASASEIVAGALRDYKRAKLVGETTFGKGTIQEAQEISSGAGLHITTSKWLLPLGDWIDKKGIKPDVEIKNNPDTKEDEQFNEAAKLLLAK